MYFYQVLCGFNALLNDDVTTAYQYIEPLTNLEFFDISLLKYLLRYLNNKRIEEKNLQQLIHYYDDSTITCSSKVKEIIQALKTTYA